MIQTYSETNKEYCGPCTKFESYGDPGTVVDPLPWATQKSLIKVGVVVGLTLWAMQKVLNRWWR